MTIEKIIDFLKKAFPYGIQMFNCHAWTGDYIIPINAIDNVNIFYAPYYKYIDIIGVSDEELEQINVEVNK